MKATNYQTISIKIRTVLAVLNTSLRALFICWFSRDKRERINKLARRWSKRMLDIIELDYQVYNPHEIDFSEHKPYIIMSNHRCHYDIPLIFMALPGSIRMLTKKELFKVPVWGQAMHASEFIAVDRNNTEQAIKDLELARQKMEDGIVIWVAPEGTRSPTTEMLPFKKGGFMLALQTGATIIPVGIRGTETILPPKTWDFYIREKAEVHIGEPIDANNYTLEQRDQLMADVEAVISQLLST